MIRKVTIPVLLLLTVVVCGACILMVLQTSFSSMFSLRELVKKNEANSGLNCSPGGGGSNSGIGTGAGGMGGTQSSYQKSESFSCQIADADKFDEAKFIQALKQTLEKDLATLDAEITSNKNTDASSFSIEYVLGKTSGRIEISGVKSAGYYALEAKVAEKTD